MNYQVFDTIIIIQYIYAIILLKLNKIFILELTMINQSDYKIDGGKYVNINFIANLLPGSLFAIGDLEYLPPVNKTPSYNVPDGGRPNT